jgi:lipopolysaccharide heptosyltransferase I
MNWNPQREGRSAKRVLVARLGSMGDIVHGLPVAATLHENFPEWEVDWLVERRWRALLDGNPCLNRVVEFDTLSWRASPLSGRAWRELGGAIRSLRERHYDYALDLQGALKSAIACRASGATQVIGFERPWLREPAASVFYTQRVQSNADHVVEANMALAAAVGAIRPVFRFPLPPGDPAAVAPGLPSGAIALLNPGAGWEAKQWPAAGYARLADALEKEFALPVVLNCGPREAALAEQVRAACQGAKPFPFSGSIPGLIALLRHAKLMVGPDTGPLHLAAALGVPTVALFGPTDPKRNGPYGNAHRNLRPENAVTSHSRSGPASGMMDRIRPEEVLAAARELLNEQRTIRPFAECPATDAH